MNRNNGTDQNPVDVATRSLNVMTVVGGVGWVFDRERTAERCFGNNLGYRPNSLDSDEPRGSSQRLDWSYLSELIRIAQSLSKSVIRLD